jgi:hypothetical protein
MLSLIVHAVLGVAVIWFIVTSNSAIFGRPHSGPRASKVEVALYAIGISSIGFGWYHNVTFVMEYTDGAFLNNPLWGDGSWAQYLALMFDNPASSSAGADFTMANVLILPIITIVDGTRRGIRRPWLFFVASLFTSFTFAWAFYLITAERERRHRMASAPADPVSAA